jgi:hypothetical protein
MDDLSVERVLRWAALERGTAGLSDDFGAELIAPAAPGSNLALAAAVAGAQALVTNGVARDSTRLAMLGLPVGCAGWTPVRPAAGPNREVRSLVTGTSAGARSAGGV